jgi:phage terminase Nu1 subunit (DNA packaging protein)
MAKPKPSGISATDLAALWGISRQAVGLWHSRDGCPRNKDGTYDLAAVIQWRESHWSSKLQESDERDTATQDELRAVKLAREKLKLDAERASLVPAEDVRREVERLCNVIREHAREMTDEIALKLGLAKDHQLVLDTARKAYLDRCATDMEGGEIGIG